MQQRRMLVALLAAAAMQGSIDAGAATSRDAEAGASLAEAAVLAIGSIAVFATVVPRRFSRLSFFQSLIAASPSSVTYSAK